MWIQKCFRFCETNRATCRFYASSTYSSTRACSLSESHQAFHTSVATHHREYSSAPGSVGLYPPNDHSEGTRMSLGFAHAIPAVLRSSRGSPALPFAAPVNNLCGTRRGIRSVTQGQVVQWCVDRSSPPLVQNKALKEVIKVMYWQNSSGPVVCGQVRPWSLEQKDLLCGQVSLSSPKEPRYILIVHLVLWHPRGECMPRHPVRVTVRCPGAIALQSILERELFLVRGRQHRTLYRSMTSVDWTWYRSQRLNNI